MDPTMLWQERERPAAQTAPSPPPNTKGSVRTQLSQDLSTSQGQRKNVRTNKVSPRGTWWCVSCPEMCLGGGLRFPLPPEELLLPSPFFPSHPICRTPLIPPPLLEIKALILSLPRSFPVLFLFRFTPARPDSGWGASKPTIMRKHLMRPEQICTSQLLLNEINGGDVRRGSRRDTALK